MNTASHPRSDTQAAELAEVVERLTARIQNREPVDLDAELRNYPQHEDELRRLLPALALLADWSRTPGDDGIGAAGEPLGLIGEFRLIREVGRGGMGVVYEAEQISLNRRVALKVLPYAGAMDPRQLQRFRNEAQAAACLHHPNIVPVHGVGCERGVHYYAMQLIEGQTLAQVIAEIRDEEKEKLNHRGTEDTEKRDKTVPLSSLCSLCLCGKKSSYFRQVAELVAQAADALEYAHSMGVVHRDIKPANLMLVFSPSPLAGEGWGGGSHGAHLWVTDFGLAKLNSADGITITGDVIGTLRYMSPEQALARHGLVDHRTDVYSLGATLYELLTLRPAVDGADKQEILKRIAFEEPTPLRRIEKSIPAELETITLKALAKEPGERYASAAELAQDLRRWLGDLAIKARRPSPRQCLNKWVRRHPSAAVTVALSSVLALSALWAWDRQKFVAEAKASVVATEAKTLQEAGRYTEALAVARRAVDLLPNFGGNPVLRREIEERGADLNFLCRVEEIRLDQAANVRADTWTFDRRQAGPLYRHAFRDYGADVLVGDETAIVKWLERRAPRTEIAGALDEWSRLSHDVEEVQRLSRLAEALDSAGITGQIRRAARAHDVSSLKKLAKEAAGEAPAHVLYWLADELDDADAEAEAERLLRVGVRRFPSDFWLNQRLGQILVRTPGDHSNKISPERNKEALSYYRAALAVRPRSPGAWLNVGGQLQNLNRYEEAEAAYRQAIELKPDYAAAYFALGRTLNESGRRQEAVAPFRRAFELAPTSAWIQTNLGEVLQKLGRLDEAEESFRRAVTLAEVHGEGLPGALPQTLAFSTGRLGNLLKDTGRFAEAEKVYRKALVASEKLAAEFRGQPEYRLWVPGMFTNLGIVLAETGRIADAEKMFRDALPLLEGLVTDYPDKLSYRFNLASNHNNLGFFLVRCGRLSEAQTAYRKALGEYEKLVQADFHGSEYQQLTVALHQSLWWYLACGPDTDERDSSKLVELAKKLVASAPDWAGHWNALGMAQYRAGHWKDAIASIEKSMEIAKRGDSTDWFFLAMSHRQLGNREQAESYYAQAVEWMDKDRPNAGVLRRFRAEAADVLGIKKDPTGAPVPRRRE